jgi:hypothetical protein
MPQIADQTPDVFRKKCSAAPTSLICPGVGALQLLSCSSFLWTLHTHTTALGLVDIYFPFTSFPLALSFPLPSEVVRRAALRLT